MKESNCLVRTVHLYDFACEKADSCERIRFLRQYEPFKRLFEWEAQSTDGCLTEFMDASGTVISIN